MIEVKILITLMKPAAISIWAHTKSEFIIQSQPCISSLCNHKFRNERNRQSATPFFLLLPPKRKKTKRKNRLQNCGKARQKRKSGTAEPFCLDLLVGKIRGRAKMTPSLLPALFASDTALHFAPPPGLPWTLLTHPYVLHRQLHPRRRTRAGATHYTESCPQRPLHSVRTTLKMVTVSKMDPKSPCDRTRTLQSPNSLEP